MVEGPEIGSLGCRKGAAGRRQVWRGERLRTGLELGSGFVGCSCFVGCCTDYWLLGFREVVCDGHGVHDDHGARSVLRANPELDSSKTSLRLVLLDRKLMPDRWSGHSDHIADLHLGPVAS